MTENIESNYTKEDLRHFNLNDEEIKELIGHELGDGEEPLMEDNKSDDDNHNIRKTNHKDRVKTIERQITIDELTKNNSHPDSNVNIEKTKGETIIEIPVHDKDEIDIDDPCVMYRMNKKTEEKQEKTNSAERIFKSPQKESDNQFLEIEKRKKQLKDSGDHRHLFFIPKGTLVENISRETFFRGNLNKDVLALISKDDEKHFELEPLTPNDKIKITYYHRAKNEDFTKEILKGSKIEHAGVRHTDLTHINSGYELWLSQLPKR